MPAPFTHARLALRSLRHYRRTHVPAALGVAVATAVLTGALVVGESVRGSLRGLTLERLGRYDYAVAPGRLFRVALGEELSAAEGFSERFAAVEPLLTSPASLGARSGGQTRRANRVTLHGVRPGFWSGDDRPPPSAQDGLLLTATLAEELGVAVGDDVVVRVGVASALPADSPLGEKADTTASVRAPVAGVLPDRGLARFGLRPSQQPPRNAFLPLKTTQRLLDTPDQCNALLVAAHSADAQRAEDWLRERLRPRLADYGLSVSRLDGGVWQLESEALVLPEQVVNQARKAWSGDAVESVTTYLANTLRVGDRSVPYSTVAGVRRAPGAAADLADDAIVLNRWAADDLAARPGDEVTLAYYHPESTHGVLEEAAPITLSVAGVAELVGSGGEPTAAADPRLTPRLPGVTDSATINDWDLPFELVEPIRDEDEAYWDRYSTTPKAFVSEALARRLWTTRWGATSLLRVEATEDPSPRLLAALEPADFGFAPIAVKRDGLRAASGSTPFDTLFLLFSLFLIASAAMLIALLVRLAIDARSSEVGLLGALGWDRARVRRQTRCELAIVVPAGVALGVAVGVAYAALLLWLLSTVWIDAIVTPFLRLQFSAWSLGVGALAGLVVSALAARHALNRATAAPPGRLLAGGEAEPESATRRRPPLWPPAACVVAAVGATAAGSQVTGEAAAGAFFGAGAAMLAAALLLLRRGFAARGRSPGRLDLVRLARSNVARNPGRSLLSIGLVAAASFLVLATGAFRLPPTEEGTGEFDLVAEANAPLHFDLATPDGRFELGLGDREETLLAPARVFGFRAQPGEDASCRNLYQATQPRLLGVDDAFLAAQDAGGGFTWAAHAEGFGANPWRALAAGADARGVSGALSSAPTPVVLDFNTAVYALKLYGGVGARLTLRDEAGAPFEAEVVGLLKNSLLQGEVLMAEADLLRRFPSASGDRFFLIDAPSDSGAELAAALEDRLSDYGVDVEDARRRLAGFLAVQNTYLSTFQALGALGLMLGAVGLGVAQFRSLAQRRGELALMRAAGFSPRRIGRLVFVENALLLAGGLGVGAVAALVALAPHVVTSGARPPWSLAIVLIGVTAAVGLVTGRLATRGALRAPITAALRGD